MTLNSTVFSNAHGYHNHSNYITFKVKSKFGAMHFIYYINRSIATKVDSTAHSVCLVARAGLEFVTFRSQSGRFPSTPHMSTFLTVVSILDCQCKSQCQ